MKYVNLNKMAAFAMAIACATPTCVIAEETVAAQTEAPVLVEVRTEATVQTDAETPTELTLLEELNAILQKQRGVETSSLLGEYLGTDELKETIKGKGFESMTTWGLQEGTLETLGTDLEIFENPHIDLNVMWDPVEKRWNLEIGGALNEDIAASAWLYGDTEKLLLGCEPFYDGAIGINAGSFLDQYVGSALEELLVSLADAPDISGIPDFDLIFYPENIDFSVFQAPVDDFTAKLEEKGQEVKDSLLVEKEELDDSVIYHVTCETREILEIYQMFFNEFISIALDSGAMNYEEAMDANEEIMTFMEEGEAALGDTIVVDFLTQNELLKKISYNMIIQTENLYYDEEDVLQSEMVDTAIYYEITYADPEDPMKTFDIIMDVWNPADEENKISIWMTKQTDISVTDSETSLSLMVKENDEVLYWGTPFISSFNVENGDLDMKLSIAEDEYEVMAITLDSTFTDVVKGESFVWKLDDLSMEVEGEAIGLNGTVEMTTGVQGSYVPENVVMVCEATQGELFTVMSEAMMNAQEWMSQIENKYMSETEIAGEMETEAVMSY